MTSFKLFHRTNTREMAMSLLQAGADPNLVTKRGNDALDALFRKRTYFPESWDGFETAKLLLNGALFWPAAEK